MNSIHDGYQKYMELFSKVEDANHRMARAVNLIVRFGGNDGAHHKDWVLDQVAKILLGADYDDVIEEIVLDGYEWNTGIAP